MDCDARPAARSAMQFRKAAPVGRPRRLLIVEDERIVALDLRMSLEALGYVVVGEAATSAEALEKAEQERPELVLMDVRLRGEPDGIQTAAILRERHELPVVYLTANADPTTLSRALETDPSGYLPKPYSLQSLRTTIEVALHRHESEQALRRAHGEERRRFEQHSSELTLLTERLRTEATEDPLTGLYNRRYLDLIMEEHLRAAERDRQALGFILLDLDHFKGVNDRFGHVAADAALKGLAGFLRGRVRDGDIACRYGGEEIAIVVSGASLRDALSLAERLRDGIEKLMIRFEGTLIPLTASLGVSAFPEHGSNAEQLVRAADTALYAAKAAGRNRVVGAPVA